MAETQDIIAIGPDGVENHFPAGTTDAQISAALGAIPFANKSVMPSAPTWKALALQTAAKAAPLTEAAMTEFATSPTAPKTLSGIANGLVTTGGVVKGVMSGNASQVLAAPMEGWAAGKGAYWLGRNLQSVATPIAKAAEAAAPFAQTMSTLSGASGVGDLAQMVEPGRQDIGFLGVGGGIDPNDPRVVANMASSEQKSKQYFQERVKQSQIQNLVSMGLSVQDATRRVAEAWRPR